MHREFGAPKSLISVIYEDKLNQQLDMVYINYYTTSSYLSIGLLQPIAVAFSNDFLKYTRKESIVLLPLNEFTTSIDNLSAKLTLSILVVNSSSFNIAVYRLYTEIHYLEWTYLTCGLHFMGHFRCTKVTQQSIDD